jgi:hypothetical protein
MSLHNQYSVGRLLFSSIVDTRPELDYALLVLRNASAGSAIESLKDTEESGFLHLPKFSSRENLRHIKIVDVHSTTASAGFLPGHIDCTATFFRSPYTSHYQEVYSVTFDKALAQGDCGSWVHNAYSRELHGHIIAGSPEDGIAYIVPAYQVFNDLQAFFTADKREQYLSLAAPSPDRGVDAKLNHIMQILDTNPNSEPTSSSNERSPLPLTESAVNSFNQQDKPEVMLDTWYDSVEPREMHGHG